MRLLKALAAAGLITRSGAFEQLTSAQEVADFALSSEVIKPLQVRYELRSFASIVAEQRPRTILEIGTCRGGTLFVLSRLADHKATIISIDLPNGAFGGGYKWFHIPIFRAFARKDQTIHLLRVDSHNSVTRDKVAHLLDGSNLDLLFIDGDHTYAGVKADFEMYSPFVKRGIVALHDIAKHPEATRAQASVFWEELKGKFKHSEIIEDPAQGWGGIGLLYI